MHNQNHFPKPPDVADYVEVPITYAAGTDDNVLGNGVDPDGGVPPGFTNQLLDIPTTNASGWKTTGTFGVGSGREVENGEVKFRTHFNAGHLSKDDPIRNYGQPGAAHWHVFFGNARTNAYSTFELLRKHEQYSLSAGGALNATGYWVPATIVSNAFGDGKDYIVRPDHIVGYYQENTAEVPELTHIPLGMRYVFGFDMDNGFQMMEDAVAAANAQPGTAGRYQTHNNGTHANGDPVREATPRVYCNDVESTGGFRNADGTDPFGGACTAGTDLYLEINGPRCWDGVNLWSPGGYKHVVPSVWDTVKGKWTCPHAWFRIPAFQLKVHYSHEGPNGPRGYLNWKLSSDDMWNANNPGAERLPGLTFHADWFGGWDETTLRTWENQCLGIDNEADAALCANSVISGTERLITAEESPMGRFPQVDLTGTYGTANEADMWLIPVPEDPSDIDVHE